MAGLGGLFGDCVHGTIVAEEGAAGCAEGSPGESRTVRQAG